MTQHLINLMPEDLRQQSQAGVRRGQTVAAFALAFALLIVLISHSAIRRNQNHDGLLAAQGQADLVIQLEQRAKSIIDAMDADRAHLRRYQRIALPLDVSDVIASVINQLPASVVLEGFELEAGERRRPRSARAIRKPDEGPAPRRLTADVRGFAVSDLEIAEMIDRLTKLPPLENVSLDFSRTRLVRDRLAREFRLSFAINLDVNFDVAEAPAAVVSAESSGQEPQ